LGGAAGNAGENERKGDGLLGGPRAADFYNPEKTHLYPEDLLVALDVDRFYFAVHIDMKDGCPTACIECP
jgi:hypothetical protein